MFVVDSENDDAAQHSQRLRLRSATKRMLGLSIGDSFAAHRYTVAVAKGHAPPVSAHAQESRENLSPSKRRSSSAISSASSDSDLAPALMPSLFPNVPPTINFVPDGDKGETIC